MWELVMNIVSEIVGYTFDRRWRFCLCLLAAISAASLIHWLVPGHGLRVALMVVAGAVGLIGGVAWENLARS